MAHRERDEEDDDGDLDERELPDESDMDADDEPEVVPCPYCGKGVSEEAEVCPHCRNYISREDAPQSARSSTWVTGVLLLLLVAALTGALLFFR
jgi:predicted nucleic acid-binding Zn ribbon protein